MTSLVECFSKLLKAAFCYDVCISEGIATLNFFRYIEILTVDQNIDKCMSTFPRQYSHKHLQLRFTEQQKTDGEMQKACHFLHFSHNRDLE